MKYLKWRVTGKYAMTKSMSNDQATFGAGNLGKPSAFDLGKHNFLVFQIKKGSQKTTDFFLIKIGFKRFRIGPKFADVDRGPYGFKWDASKIARYMVMLNDLTVFEWRKPYNWIWLADFSCIQNRVVQRCIFAGHNKSFISGWVYTWEHATSFAECLALMLAGFRYSWRLKMAMQLHSGNHGQWHWKIHDS